jgi:cell division protease FtsH
MIYALWNWIFIRERRAGMKKIKTKYIIAGILILAVLSAAFFLYRGTHSEPEKISYNKFLQLTKEGKIQKVYLDNTDKLQGEYTDGEAFITDNPRMEGLKESLLLQNIVVEEKDQSLQKEQIFTSAFALALIGVVVYFSQKNASGQKMGVIGKSSFNAVIPEKTNISFDDVAGNEEAKESLQELVDFIKNPEKYARLGARLPRGVVFYGSPGTGKTLMAKAVAGESNVPFISVSGSDFVQVYVGLGASRIRDLFKKARSFGKCVIFIDEIDALGKKRSGSLDSGGNDERDQTLNALLSEMSGFEDNEGIVVIAATNRLDVLDEALLRPGRFDRHIEIQLPDIRSRLKILKLHAKNKPLDNGVDLEEVAQNTVYFSGAKLENLLNEAAILAARRCSDKIHAEDIVKAFYTVVAGSEKKDRSGISQEDRRVTAFHEAGHALVTRLIAPENRVTRITIIPSTKGAGGFSMNIPPDRMYHRKRDMENSIKIALAGRAAEELAFGTENITTGAANDLEKATETLLNMFRRFGMNKRSGLLNYDVLYNNGFQQVQDEILEECRKRMDELFNEVMNLLKENKKLLVALAESLLLKETLDEKDLDFILQACEQAG